MAAEIPSGAPHNRDEEFALYLGGAGDEPAGAPQNREEEWLLWLQENAGGGGSDTFTVSLSENDGVYSADKTYQEVLDAIEAGRRIVWAENGVAFPPMQTSINYNDMSICATEVGFPHASEESVTDYDAPVFQSFYVNMQIVYSNDGSIAIIGGDPSGSIVPAQREVTIVYDVDDQQWAFQDPNMSYDKLLAWLNSYVGSDYTISPVIYLWLDDDVVRLYYTGGDATGTGEIYLTGAICRSKVVTIVAVIHPDDSIDVESQETLPDTTGKNAGDILTLGPVLDPAWESPVVVFDMASEYQTLYVNMLTLFQSWLTAAVQSPGSIVTDNVTGTDYSAFITDVSNAFIVNKRIYLNLYLDNQNNYLPVINFSGGGYVTTRMTGVYAVQGIGDYLFSADIVINNADIFVSGYAIAV